MLALVAAGLVASPATHLSLDAPRLEAAPPTACPCLEATNLATPLAGGGSSSSHAPGWRRLLHRPRPWMLSA